MIRRSLSILLCLALILSMSCCGVVSGIISPESADGSGGENNSTSPYQQVWHGDVAYSDMEYVHYDLEQFSEYTSPIYDIAENGGTEEEFYDADFYLYDELNYIYTLYTLMDLRSNADISDEYAAEESQYTLEVYYDALSEYYDAMHAVAVSPYAQLMEGSYSQSLIDYFKSYEPSSDGGRDIFTLENDLVSQYYTMISQAEPDYEAIGELYVELVELRRQQAQLYGYQDYASYAYDSVYYKDYTPEDAKAVWQGVKEYIVPVMMTYGPSLQEKTDLLYSSDIDCSTGAVLSAMGSVLPQIAPELNEAFEYMTDYGLYDIGYSENKVNTGFTTVLYFYNEPFIFNAATGTYRDYTDMFHEFGHFANYFYTQSSLVFGSSDYDLSELQSQGLEALASFFYSDIFGSELGNAAQDSIILSMMFSIVDGAMYDEFQQRVYSQEDLTPEAVTSIFKEVYDEYGYAPYEGYEYEWMYINHNFENPFYYISYSVSAAAALEILSLAYLDWDAAVERYVTVSAMDTEAYYYSQALEEAGFADIFDSSAYMDLASTLSAMLG